MNITNIINDLGLKCSILGVYNGTTYENTCSDAYVLIECLNEKLWLFDDNLIIPNNTIGNEAYLSIQIYPHDFNKVNKKSEILCASKTESKYINFITARIDSVIDNFYRLRVKGYALYIPNYYLDNKTETFNIGDMIEFHSPRLDIIYAKWPRKIKNEELI